MQLAAFMALPSPDLFVSFQSNPLAALIELKGEKVIQFHFHFGALSAFKRTNRRS